MTPLFALAILAATGSSFDSGSIEKSRLTQTLSDTKNGQNIDMEDEVRRLLYSC